MKALDYISSSDWCPAGALKPWSYLISITDARQEGTGIEALCESLKRLKVIYCISPDLPPWEQNKTMY